jgi:5-methylcytosine-specific restriction endonuclease McrA
MALRYLEAALVDLPNRAPLFVEEGHCQWCNRELTGRQRLYCSEECTLAFYNYWINRPAYVRATFIRDDFTCQQCGLHPMREDKPWLPDLSRLECDHIIPLARGGETTMGNLQTLCWECNRKKGISVPGEAVQDLPRVIPSRDGSKCPSCRARGYRVLPWQPPKYYDPWMIKVVCLNCGGQSYIAPAPWARRPILRLSKQFDIYHTPYHCH